VMRAGGAASVHSRRPVIGLVAMYRKGSKSWRRRISSRVMYWWVRCVAIPEVGDQAGDVVPPRRADAVDVLESMVAEAWRLAARVAVVAFGEGGEERGVAAAADVGRVEAADRLEQATRGHPCAAGGDDRGGAGSFVERGAVAVEVANAVEELDRIGAAVDAGRGLSEPVGAVEVDVVVEPGDIADRVGKVRQRPVDEGLFVCRMERLNPTRRIDSGTSGSALWMRASSVWTGWPTVGSQADQVAAGDRKRDRLKCVVMIAVAVAGSVRSGQRSQTALGPMPGARRWSWAVV
jgi:hypothetical protein